MAIIFNKWHIFVKLRPSSFFWCNSYDAYFTHEWLKLFEESVPKGCLAGGIWIPKRQSFSRSSFSVF